MTRTTLKVVAKPAADTAPKFHAPTRRPIRGGPARRVPVANAAPSVAKVHAAVEPAPASAPRAPRKVADKTRFTPRGVDGKTSGKTGDRPRFSAPRGTENRGLSPKPPPRPAPVSQHDQPRLSKVLSERGMCSRREADDWIANGWVKVDGVVVEVLGTRVDPGAKIDIDPEATRDQMEQVTILLHKPIGYVSGQAEDGHQPASVLVRPDNRWDEDPAQTKFKRGHLHGLAPAGRLDIDSTGLLVLTQDGRVAKRLIGEDSAVEKEYLVRIEGTLTAQGMKKLQHGLELDGKPLKPARVSWQNEEQLRIVLREGKKRQIRRMCEAVGVTVTGLKRIRIGSVVLSNLPVGKWRYLQRGEKF
jgi:23S rRNA pseudouridine2604 synthase